MLKDFRKFILRGNVVDLAVGVVMGAAFGSVVTSLVKNIITPMTGVFGNAALDPVSATAKIGKATFAYGLFINDLIAFLLLAFSVFFFVVKPVNKLMELRKTQPEVESPTRDCPFCLSSIPTAAMRCAFCTQEVSPAPS